MLWFSSYVIVFEFSWKVKEKKIGGITYWLTLVYITYLLNQEAFYYSPEPWDYQTREKQTKVQVFNTYSLIKRS